MGVFNRIGDFGGRVIGSAEGYSADKQQFGIAVARAKRKRTISGRDTQKNTEALAFYVKRVLAPVTARYQVAGYANVLCAKQELKKTPVWFCWWQGEDYMPDSVRLCYARIRRMTPDTAAVHLITLKNVKSYLDFPPVVEEKYYRRELNLQALTDVLRASLLCAYGGVWVDSSLYATRPLDPTLFSASFFSPKLHYGVPSQPSQGLWNSALLAVRKNPTSMNYLRDAFTLWWETHDAVLDERQFDFFLLNAYRELAAVRGAIDEVPPNNTVIDALKVILNEPFSRARYAALEPQSAFFDLSCEVPWRKQTPEGEETLFGFLFRREFGADGGAYAAEE